MGVLIAQKLAARVRSLDSTRPLTEAFPGATFTPATDAVFSVLDVGGYNYNLAQNQAKDHERVPGRIMMTTESLPATAFEQWQVVHDHPYILGEFVWTAMDYLGESGIGSWSYATPEQAKIRAGFFAAERFPDGRQVPAPFDPKPGLDAAHEAQSLARAIERFRSATGPFPAHPIIGPLSRDEWLRFHTMHAEHHLGFAVPT